MKEIRQIITQYDKLKSSGQKMALASVIRIEESSYRRVGARMLVAASGEWVGGISGGCLEGDALRRSQLAIYSDETSIVRYDTLDGDDNQIGIGLGCHGIIDVFFSPIDVNDEKNEIEQLRLVLSIEKPALLLKLISSEIKHEVGTSKVIFDNQHNFNFLDIPNHKLQTAIDKVDLNKRAAIVDIKYDNKVKDILIEYIRPEIKLVLIGDNFDATALSVIAAELGWYIYVVGRKRKMSKLLVSKARQIYDYDQFSQVPIDPYTSVVLMTHDFARDMNLIPEIAKHQLTYFGILGPKKRRDNLVNDLKLSEHQMVNHLYSPIGLDIGAETPEEIAISIIAEILAIYRKRNGNFLRDRQTPIHERDKK